MKESRTPKSITRNSQKVEIDWNRVKNEGCHEPEK